MRQNNLNMPINRGLQSSSSEMRFLTSWEWTRKKFLLSFEKHLLLQKDIICFYFKLLHHNSNCKTRFEKIYSDFLHFETWKFVLVITGQKMTIIQLISKTKKLNLNYSKET